MNTLLQDLRYGVRMLLKAPGLTAVVVLSLALGIGANATIFALIDALLLKPLPAERPEELAALYTSDYSGPLYGTTSYPDYLDFSQRATAFDGLVAYAPRAITLSEGERPEHVTCEMVTANYFDVLGVRPAQGRAFGADEHATDARRSVVISQSFWRKRLGGAPDVVGRQLVLNNQSFTVVGVAPPEWHGMFRGVGVDLWLPLEADSLFNPGSEALRSRGARWLFVIGRLRRGTTLAEAQAQLAVLARQQREAYPQQWRNVRGEGRAVTLVPESEARIMPALRGPVVGFMGLLMSVVLLVLAVACANTAGLLLARATARRREIAIRLSLGASRARLVRQLLTESLLLSLLGGALGLLGALWATDLLLKFKPPFGVTLALDLTPDARVIGFTLAASVLTAFAFGLVPAVQATRPELVPALKDEAGAAGYRRSRLRGLLVVAQVAVSLLLLVGAGLFLRSLSHASAIDPGFNTQNLLLVNLDLRDVKEAPGLDLYERMLARLGALPGVRAVSMTGEAPLQLGGSRRSVDFEGYEPRPGEDMEIAYSIVGPGYHHAMEIPLARGRDFDERDRTGAPGVCIINETLARQYFHDEDALGRRLSVAGPQGPFLEVVGVARDGKYWTLGEEPRPFLTLPLWQHYENATTLLVRTEGDPQALIRPVRGEIEELDPQAVIAGVETMTEHLRLVLLPARVAGVALALFGLVALALASVGVYGTVAFYVGQRTREFGIRLALGAQRSDILGLVIREGMVLVCAGVVIGLAGALAVTRLLTSLLYGISPTDPLTFGVISLLLVAVALVASYLPARRATRVDPMEALRYE